MLGQGWEHQHPGRAGHTAHLSRPGVARRQRRVVFGATRRELFVFHLRLKFRSPALELSKSRNSVCVLLRPGLQPTERNVN